MHRRFVTLVSILKQQQQQYFYYYLQALFYRWTCPQVASANLNGPLSLFS